MEILRLVDVHHDYGERPVLAGVDLGVRAAECVALLGDNGAGKSTLLRIAAGRELPVRGDAFYRDSPADENQPHVRTGIAAVLEAGACYPDLTVREHLMLVALAHGGGEESQATVDRALARHRLADHADVLPSGLSSGLTQLLALATAWVRPYDLLILDEPEQRLDARARTELAERLRAAKHNGAALLIATHDPGLAAEVSDHTFTLDDGQLRTLTAP
ncbi:ABC transporter ATP-binding protein [Streptomyces litchfieldiae]|uniref:ABC transporter ATP-binding protein n=1 Tax=Streptomyces litchfieldiae TaxID=3075543 RepID=A0ABU2MZG3_9ACTN|nr:ABC transporter ATP-binding protein [Streptomyces sp. DSM 44938]MDT0347051.1 ABC transporter ATP-binding protein [Streptomyces sp. DSM 44938]